MNLLTSNQTTHRSFDVPGLVYTDLVNTQRWHVKPLLMLGTDDGVHGWTTTNAISGEAFRLFFYYISHNTTWTPWSHPLKTRGFRFIWIKRKDRYLEQFCPYGEDIFLCTKVSSPVGDKANDTWKIESSVNVKRPLHHQSVFDVSPSAWRWRSAVRRPLTPGSVTADV